MSERGLDGPAKRVAGADLAAWLAARRVALADWSPLAALANAPRTAGATAPSLGPAQASAIAAVANPALELTLLLSPPDEGVKVRFYRPHNDGASWIGHQTSAQGEHLFVSSDAEQLAALLVATCEQDGPPARLDLDLQLIPATLLVVAGAIDTLRTRTLQSLLQRRRLTTTSFTAAEVAATLAASVGSDDRRWLGAVVAAVCPVELALSATACAEALGQLATSGLVARQGDLWSLAPSLQLACSALSSPLAYCAGRVRHPAGTAGDDDHFAVIRTQAAICWLGFRGPGGEAVRVRDVSAEQLARALGQRLGPRAAPPPARPAAGSFCRRCGANLAPAAKFCTACGEQVPAAR